MKDAGCSAAGAESPQRSTSTETRSEVGAPIFADRLAQFPEKLLVVGQIVPRQQNRPEHLVHQEQVADIGPRELSADRTGTLRIERSFIPLVLLVAQPEECLRAKIRSRFGHSASAGRSRRGQSPV